jgi:O-acetyl-ADP-ribose deacetylase (regulator of RNase III)
MIKYIEGDLFDYAVKDTVIAHVCNCHGGWGSGFVVPLGNKYPKSKERYLLNDDWGFHRLGELQLEELNSDRLYVANMIAQTLGGSRPLSYEHLVFCMHYLKKQIIDENLSISAPLFGAGLAGGDWNIIKELIKDCWSDSGIEVNIYWLPHLLPKGVLFSDLRG